MVIETKKVFQQDISGTDMLGLDPGHGKIEICVLSGTRISPEDKAAFLQNLESCLCDAYIWTAAQLGANEKSEVIETKSHTTDYDNYIEATTAAIRDAFQVRKPDDSGEKRIDNLGNTIVGAISQSGCTYKEVAKLLHDLLMDYKIAAMNQVIKETGDCAAKESQ